MDLFIKLWEIVAILYLIVHKILYFILLIRETEVTYTKDGYIRQANWPRRKRHLWHIAGAIIVILLCNYIQYKLQ